MIPSIIAELPEAVLRGYTNELALDQIGVNQQPGDPTTPRWDDPVKIRLGGYTPADRNSFYCGAVGFDVLDGDKDDPRRLEKGFLAFKMDPEPCIEIYLQRTAETTEDADMLCILRITSAGLELDPKHAGGMGLKGFGPVSDTCLPFASMVSPVGNTRLELQDDGNFVRYVRQPDGSFEANWTDDTGTLP